MMFEDIPYLCTIPYVAPSEGDNSTKSEEEEQQELVRASDHGWQLLQGMQEQQCLYYGAGWWMYSFCYNQGIKQFHPLPPGRAGVPIFPPQEDTSIESYYLGKYEDPPTDPTEDHSTEPPSLDSQTTEAPTSPDPSTKDLTHPVTLKTRDDSRYLVQNLSGGTTCDLTRKPRRVEIQYHCNPSKPDHINLIRETASCVYLMVVHTPRLCNDVAFLPPQIDRPQPITCQEIVSEDGVEEWKAWKAETLQEQLAEMERLNAAPPLTSDGIPGKPPLIIGGIEVGGQQLVGGTPERTIKASSIVDNSAKRGKRDQYLATLAKSDGKTVTVMSDAEMDKLGLEAVKKEAERYRNRLKSSAAGGMPWKLELWRTGDGEEFRMMIGMEVLEEDEGREEGKGKSGEDGAKEWDSEEGVGAGKDEKADEGGEPGSEEEFK